MVVYTWLSYHFCIAWIFSEYCCSADLRGLASRGFTVISVLGIRTYHIRPGEEITVHGSWMSMEGRSNPVSLSTLPAFVSAGRNRSAIDKPIVDGLIG